MEEISRRYKRNGGECLSKMERTGGTQWNNFKYISSVQSLSRVRLFATPWTAACQVSLSVTNFWSLLKLMFITSVMPSNHLILCRPLLLLPLIFPTLRVFSNESIVLIRWSEYWSFSFSISPSNEYSNAYYSENDTALMVEVMGVSSRSWRVLLFPFYLYVMAKKLQ